MSRVSGGARSNPLRYVELRPPTADPVGQADESAQQRKAWDCFTSHGVPAVTWFVNCPTGIACVLNCQGCAKRNRHMHTNMFLFRNAPRRNGQNGVVCPHNRNINPCGLFFAWPAFACGRHVPAWGNFWVREWFVRLDSQIVGDEWQVAPSLPRNRHPSTTCTPIRRARPCLGELRQT